MRVRDLVTGQVRRFHTRARYASLYAEVGADGRVLLDEFSRRRPEGIPRELVRLAGPAGSGRDGLVVHDSHDPSRRLSTPYFCGTHPVAFAMTPRGRYELKVLDTGAVIAAGRILDPDHVDVSCDAASMVVISSRDGRLSLIDIHPLPG